MGRYQAIRRAWHHSSQGRHSPALHPTAQVTRDRFQRTLCTRSLMLSRHRRINPSGSRYQRLPHRPRRPIYGRHCPSCSAHGAPS
jgi:hypothetical protein